MGKFCDDVRQITALVEMVSLAKDSGLPRGVAFISVQNKYILGTTQQVRFKVVDSVIKRESNSEGDAGTNYFGVAMAKLAVMMGCVGRNSGYPGLIPKAGEVKFRGGIVREVGNYMIYTGFSGGTEDMDVEIANLGMKVLITGEGRIY